MMGAHVDEAERPVKTCTPAATALALASSATALPSNCSASGSTVTCRFSSTGAAQSFSVPSGVTSSSVATSGAQGGGVVGDSGRDRDARGERRQFAGGVRLRTW
jgi:hypothetical protein